MFISDTGGRRSSLDEITELAVWCETAGLASGWVPYLPWSLDAFVALTAVGRATTRIELGTAVVPTYPFHPMAMARSALSVNAAIGGRLALGIGPSHPSVIEGMYGYQYDRPARHTADYVAALRRAFSLDGTAEAHGDFFDFRSMFDVPGATPPQLLIAALAPRMLQLAGEQTDGTILWFADETALESHVVPKLTAAAAAAGRTTPRIVSAMPTAVVDDEGAAREQAARAFATYAQIPTYRRILDRGAGANPADVVLAGSERTVADRLRRWRDLGVTDVVAAPFPVGGDRDASLRRTREALATIAEDVGRS
ncbi:MAG TPA: TIGR03564 family F420-dependent LLM class oxidoreductase [Acidimicrobiales bacterium]|jgi:F420-dependent oxidoreductase-like protein|nr:TIGR03564 family F420-dependent LLM class oxidoreductase [Acidimicrobiales bacterium]